MDSVSGEIPDPLSACHVSSFAYFTVKERLPVILTKVLDALHREREAVIQKYGKESREGIKEVIGHLSRLKSEIQTDKPVVELTDSREDVALWNLYIQCERNKTKANPSWFTSAWLLVECYMYRRIQEAFELGGDLKVVDPFQAQKETALLNSLDAINNSANFLSQSFKQECDEATIHNFFCTILQLDLWGNRCDLSISCGVENSQTTDLLTDLDQLKSNILVNDMDLIWNSLQCSRSRNSGNVRVDFILDNAGFELYTDLCLADFLLTKKLARVIYFHVKEMPWFVSDTTQSDFQWVIKTLKTLVDEPLISNLASKWEKYLEHGQWKVVGNLYWTLPHDFSEMEKVSPQLYHELSQSDLLIFKGDLNYRKLTGDRNWAHTTPFHNALRGFHPTTLCTLRTIKADVVVGLKGGQAEATRELHEDWLISGEFAVVQLDAP